jgi:hypothetical protein
MVESFDEVYPEVDEGFVQTLRQLHHENIARSDRDQNKPIEPTTKQPLKAPIKVSKEAEQILYALWHKKHWGTHSVTEGTIKNHYCNRLQNFESAIKELLKTDLLIAEHNRGPFTLNRKSKAQIELLIQKITGTKIITE